MCSTEPMFAATRWSALGKLSRCPQDRRGGCLQGRPCLTRSLAAHECVSSLRRLLNIGINAARASSPWANGHIRSLAMSKLALTEQHARERVGFAARVPISISRDDSRDHADHRMLYVLAFRIAGAVLTNARPFIYFASVYASR